MTLCVRGSKRAAAAGTRLPLSARSWSASSRCPAPRSLLPTTPARTRFAPSPTGLLHLGSLRTALFNFLLARATGGTFLLRIEDTDSRRTVPGAEDALYQDLQWAGLQWDEGPLVGGSKGPYRQSDRTALYKAHAAQLVEQGAGYRCFCSSERLDELARRRQALGMPTDYDRACAHLSEAETQERVARGDKHIVRLKAPGSYPSFHDLVYGKVGKDGGGFNAGITVKHGEIAYEDPVLLKSDGTPTYHLANVVDDHLMNITHVVRASEWLPSTPKHLAIYDAFKWTPPQFAHVGLLVDGDGRKLSKRQMDTGVAVFRQNGVLARSLINFAALLGWSHDRRGDIMDLQDLIDVFSMRFTKGNATVDEGKLWFLQRAHMSRVVERVSTASDSLAQQDFETSLDRLVQVVHDQFRDTHYQQLVDKRPLRAYVQQILSHDARNYTTPEAFIRRNRCFFRPTASPPIVPDWLASDSDQAHTLANVASDASRLSAMEGLPWVHDSLERAMKSATMAYAQRQDLTTAEGVQRIQKELYRLLCKYMRWALLEGNDGPGLGWTMEILGQKVSLIRLEAAKAAIFAPKVHSTV